MKTFKLITSLMTIVIFQLFVMLYAQDKPNIVLIMADDIGIGDIGYYHKERTGKTPLVPTPHIDKLISEGMRFSDAHSPASLCAPTRFSMLTGNFSYRNEKGPWGVWSPEKSDGIDPKFTTIARIAKKGGYKTAFFGKWGLGGLWTKRYEDYSNYKQTEGGPQDLGFDYSLVLPQGIQNKPYAFYENSQWMKLEKDSKLVHIPFEQTKYGEDNRNRRRDGVGDSNWDPVLAGPILANKAVDYITNQRKTNQPFFLYYCSQAVHAPHTPSDNLNNTAIAGTTLGKHGDMIKELDAQLGMIIKALKKNGKYKNTLFIFTSDNGGLNQDKALRDAGHNSSNNLTGKKGSIYEGGHRVPFIAVWPNKIDKHSQSNVAIFGQDMVATVAAIANIPLDKTKVFDAINLLPAFNKKPLKNTHNYLIHQSQGNGGPYYAIREGDWKLVFKTKGREKWETIKTIGLFNLKESINEDDSHNKIDDPQYAKKIQQMQDAYLKLRKTGVSTTL